MLFRQFFEQKHPAPTPIVIASGRGPEALIIDPEKVQEAYLG